MALLKADRRRLFPLGRGRVYLSVRVVNGIILTAVMLAFISTAKRKATLYNLARRWHKQMTHDLSRLNSARVI